MLIEELAYLIFSTLPSKLTSRIFISRKGMIQWRHMEDQRQLIYSSLSNFSVKLMRAVLMVLQFHCVQDLWGPKSHDTYLGRFPYSNLLCILFYLSSWSLPGKEHRLPCTWLWKRRQRLKKEDTTQIVNLWLHQNSLIIHKMP